MTPPEVAKMVAYLAASCAPAPEGNDLRALLAAWSDVFAEVPLSDMQTACRAHVKDTTPTSDHDPRPRGGWWPKPADLLARIDAVDENAEAWSHIRGHLTGYVDQSGLTRAQRVALASLPDTFARRQMSSGELDRLRSRFLQVCREYKPPAAPVVIPMTEPRRLADLDRQQATEFTRRAFAYAPRSAAPPCADPSERRNEQGGPKAVKPAPLRAPVDDAELRERARVAADAIRARVAK
jgi:hypothetical protein